MQIPPRNRCMKQVGILISYILQKTSFKWWQQEERNWHLSQAAFFKQLTKKSSSSCEYDLTLCRNEINKCLTACVKQAFGCPTLHFQFPETLMEKSAEWTRSMRTGSSHRKLTPQLLQVFPPASSTPANAGNTLHKNACDQVNTVKHAYRSWQTVRPHLVSRLF